MTRALDLSKTLELGWQTFTRQPLALILGLALASLVTFLTAGLAVGPMTVGYLRMCVRAARGEDVGAGDVFVDLSGTLVPSLLLSLWVGLAVGIGSLLVLPGLLFACMFYFAPFIMAERPSTGSLDAMKASVEIFKRDVGGTILFALVGAVLWLVGTGLGLGWLITGPVAAAMGAHGLLRAGYGASKAASAA